MEHIFIININSNVGKTADRVEEIREICKSLDVDYKIYVTSTRAETIDVAKQFKDDEFCVVYAVGGDGTVNAVLNSLIGGKAYLGVVPLGSGNDFCRSLNFLVTECNVMKINDLYCLNIFSAGIDAEICAAAEKMKKLKFPGNQIYNLGILYAFFKHRNEPMLIEADGVRYYDPAMTMVTVCNGKFYGNGKKIAPNASLSTPGADLYMVAGMKKREMPAFLNSVIKGEHEEYDGLIKTTAKNILITSDRPVIANVDGEILESDQYNIDAAAGKIKVVRNERVLSRLRK